MVEAAEPRAEQALPGPGGDRDSPPLRRRCARSQFPPCFSYTCEGRSPPKGGPTTAALPLSSWGYGGRALRPPRAGDAHGWLGQIWGRKLFVLYPPSASPSLYVLNPEAANDKARCCSSPPWAAAAASSSPPIVARMRHRQKTATNPSAQPGSASFPQLLLRVLRGPSADGDRPEPRRPAQRRPRRPPARGGARPARGGPGPRGGSRRPAGLVALRGGAGAVPDGDAQLLPRGVQRGCVGAVCDGEGAPGCLRPSRAAAARRRLHITLDGRACLLLQECAPLPPAAARGESVACNRSSSPQWPADAFIFVRITAMSCAPAAGNPSSPGQGGVREPQPHRGARGSARGDGRRVGRRHVVPRFVVAAAAAAPAATTTDS